MLNCVFGVGVGGRVGTRRLDGGGIVDVKGKRVYRWAIHILKFWFWMVCLLLMPYLEKGDCTCADKYVKSEPFERCII